MSPQGGMRGGSYSIVHGHHFFWYNFSEQPSMQMRVPGSLQEEKARAMSQHFSFGMEPQSPCLAHWLSDHVPSKTTMASPWAEPATVFEFDPQISFLKVDCS